MGLIDKEWMDAYHQGLNLTLNNMKLETSLSLQELLQTIQEDTNVRLSNLENTIQEEVNTKISNIENTLDDKDLPKINNNRLEITDSSGNRYFATITLLLAPNTPTVSTTTKRTVTGSVQFNFDVDSGATCWYQTSNDETTWSEWTLGSSITVASGFTNSINNTSKAVYVKLKAVKNGEWSDPSNSITLTIYPNLGDVGTITVSGNKYSTSRTVTVTKSNVSGATNQYKLGNGTWTTFTESSKEVFEVNSTTTPSNTLAANYISLKITNPNGIGTYDVSERSTSYSSPIEINAKKFYWGIGDSSLSLESDIKGLTGGDNAEKDNFTSGTYTITKEGTNALYVWFCAYSGTITAISTPDNTKVPFESVLTIAGYKCYRVSSNIAVAGNHTFVVTATT